MIIRKLPPITLITQAILGTSVLYTVFPTFAAENDNLEPTERIVILGSRNQSGRSEADSPVPVDVISGGEFDALGNTGDITDNLKTLIPSYTATPATGDGSAFVRPTSMRGMAPDQTLVLVNGKRRHRSALVHFFAPAAGNGAHGVDVGMIPSIALKRVEVLRDGAASQYGSDAIAGVINFVTKDYQEGGEIQLNYGQFYDGEDSIKFASNFGFSFLDTGFINISLEHIDNEALSRGTQRPDAQALIDAGIPGVGSDSPFGDTPLVQSWGRPETKSTRLFVNSGMDINNDLAWYLFGNYAETEGRYRFFYRNPEHSSIQTLRDLGFTGLQAGYTPFLDGDQQDISLTSGVKGEFANEWYFDLSASFGENQLDYFLNNTLNPSLGLDTNGLPVQRNFDVGEYQQEEITLNLDISKPLSDQVNLAFGVEWREETYTAIAGEENSYLGAGSNGFTGIRPEDSGAFSRDNYATYMDIEHDLTDDLLIQYALRYEDFSDFGNTLNWKIASKYQLNDWFILRGAISTGFHAPTPGQANIRATITTFDGSTGQQIEEGLVPPDSPLALAVGGSALKEEESTNYSVGFSANLDLAKLTVDFYKIEVDDRIYRTGDIPVAGSADSTISFYTNALDIESQGVDIVINSDFTWTEQINTALTFSYNYNKVEVVDQSLVGDIQPVGANIIEDIENNYPNDRFVLNTVTHFSEQWELMVRANYYGKHYDERGTIGAEVDPSFEVGRTIFIDMELAYQFSESTRIALGATNIFDDYVDTIDAPFANRQGVGLPYPRRSAANYEGGSWYLRVGYQF